jgi:hypothetical protein
MKPKILCLAIALFAFSACTSQPAISNDAPSGTWSGNYEVVPGRSESISVELRWDEPNHLRGVVRSGFRTLPITKASFNRDTGAITIEFDAEGNGRTVHYIVDGKVSGNTMTGSWSHDDQRGAFRVTKE